MPSFEPNTIRLTMAGERKLYRPDVLLPLLQGFQQHPRLVPLAWGLDERAERPYDEAQVARVADGVASPYVLHLRRAKQIKHSTYIRLSDRPGVTVELPRRASDAEVAELFALADTLTTAYQPDLAWVHLAADREPPFTSADLEIQYLMDSGVVGSDIAYDDDGPGGLGMRTYLGPRLVALFGRDLLRTAPVLITELPWGGMRLDLTRDPWQAPLADLTVAWQRAMDQLRPAQVFSAADRDDDGYVYFTRGARFDPGERR